MREAPKGAQRTRARAKGHEEGRLDVLLSHVSTRHPNPVKADAFGMGTIEEVASRAAAAMRQEVSAIHGCGEQGCAVRTATGSVLKVTIDRKEIDVVHAAIEDGIYDGFARVYVAPRELWQVSGARPVYGYVREDITPAEIERGGVLHRALIWLKSQADQQNRTLYLKALPDVERMAPGIGAFARRLLNRGELLGDMHAQNLGRRADGTLVMFDGRLYPDAPVEEALPQPAPAPAVLPEGFEAAMAEAERRLGVTRTGPVTSSGFAGTAPVEGGVLRVTIDPREILGARFLADHPHPGFPRMKSLVEVPFPGSRRPMGAYVREALDPLPAGVDVHALLGGYRDALAERMLEMLTEHPSSSRYRDELGRMAREPGMGPLAEALQGALALGVVFTLTADNVGMTTDGRLVLFDAQASLVERMAYGGPLTVQERDVLAYDALKPT